LGKGQAFKDARYDSVLVRGGQDSLISGDINIFPGENSTEVITNEAGDKDRVIHFNISHKGALLDGNIEKQDLVYGGVIKDELALDRLNNLGITKLAAQVGGEAAKLMTYAVPEWISEPDKGLGNAMMKGFDKMGGITLNIGKL
jgi:hypothetical protein